MFDTFKIILESGFKHFKQAFPKSLCEIRFILHLENAWTSFSVVHGSSHDYIITFFILSQRSGINFNYVINLIYAHLFGQCIFHETRE